MPTTNLSPPRRTYTRTVSRQGNSIMMAIPTGVLYTLDLLPGDKVEIAIDDDHKAFSVIPLRSARGRGQLRGVLVPAPGVQP